MVSGRGAPYDLLIDHICPQGENVTAQIAVVLAPGFEEIMASDRLKESYDPSIAKVFMESNELAAGLPSFLGLRFVEFSPGRVRAEMEVRPDLLTPFGSIHGGVMAAICDHVLGCVCYPHMKNGQWAATTEFKLNYLASVSQGTIGAEAEIISMTRTTAVVRIEVSNEGRTACIAQGTVLIREPRGNAS